jgi:HD superfamily phosphohydrolase
LRDEFSVFQTNVNLNRRGESHIYQYFRPKVIVLRKIINDPVHGFITIDHELIYQLIAHPYYQRLRRIKQMALAYLVYPGAVHTRLHHSLGAYHLMHLAILELRQKGTEITPEEELGAKIAILLHDIGHGPFSHALEHTIVDVTHEALSILIMEKLNRIFDGQLETALQIFKNEYPKKFLHQLISGQLDVDRMDYLARDSFFTGVSEGVIGYDRIIKMLTVENDQLLVEEKGIHSIEKFLIARRLMYSQVYLHKTVLSSELMLVKILQRAKFLMSQGQSLFATPSLNFFLQHRVNMQDFLNQENCLAHFLQLDDHDVVCSLKVWMHHDDSILADLCRRLIDRDLFKVEFIQDQEVTKIQEIKQQVQEKFQLNEESMGYYFVEDSTVNHTYVPGEGDIHISYKSGEVIEISLVEQTLIREGLLLPIKKHYICHPRLNK